MSVYWGFYHLITDSRIHPKQKSHKNRKPSEGDGFLINL